MTYNEARQIVWIHPYYRVDFEEIKNIDMDKLLKEDSRYLLDVVYRLIATVDSK